MSNALLEQLNACLPHGPAMRMIAGIHQLSVDTIDCSVACHTDPNNPLRSEARLGSASGIEMVAQAAALHCIWLANEIPANPENALKQDGAPAGAVTTARGGMLTSVRELILHVDRLDTINEPLRIRAERSHGDNNGALYKFSMYANNQQELLRGRLSLVLFVR